MKSTKLIIEKKKTEMFNYVYYGSFEQLKNDTLSIKEVTFINKKNKSLIDTKIEENKMSVCVKKLDEITNSVI